MQKALSYSIEKVLVVQVDNRVLQTDNGGAAPLNRELKMSTASYSSLTPVLNHYYCKKHGYDYLLINPFLKVNNTLDVHSDGRQTAGAFHAGLNQLRAVSWAKLPALLYITLHIGAHYDLIWYLDSDIGISNAHTRSTGETTAQGLQKPEERSLKDKFSEWMAASKCLGPPRSTPCITWGNPNLSVSPLILFPNTPFGDLEPCAGTFMFRPQLAASMLLEWWDVNMTSKNFGLMHEQDALWKLTSDGRASAKRREADLSKTNNSHSSNAQNPSIVSLTRDTATLLQEFQFPQNNDKQARCVDGQQWLCHLMTTDSELRAPWFREMLSRTSPPFTQERFHGALRHIKAALSMSIDMLRVADEIEASRHLLANNIIYHNISTLLSGAGKRVFPSGLRHIRQNGE